MHRNGTYQPTYLRKYYTLYSHYLFFSAFNSFTKKIVMYDCFMEYNGDTTYLVFRRISTN